MYASGDDGSPGTSFILESDKHRSAVNTCFHFLYSIQVSTLYSYSFSIMLKIKDTPKSLNKKAFSNICNRLTFRRGFVLVQCYPKYSGIERRLLYSSYYDFK